MRLVPHGRDLVSLKNPFFRYFFASKDYIDKGTDRGCHDHGKSLGFILFTDFYFALSLNGFYTFDVQLHYFL